MQSSVIHIYNCAIAILIAFACLSGCGSAVPPPNHLVTLGSPSTSSALSSPVQTDKDELQQIQDLITLYFHGEGMTRTGLTHLFTKYENQITDFLGGTSIAPEDLVNLLFVLDRNHTGRLTDDEVMGQLKDYLPIFRLMTPDHELSSGDLDSYLSQEYPTASAVARAGLRDSLLRFSKITAKAQGASLSGEKVDSTSMATAGVILSVIQQPDLTQAPIVDPGSSADPTVVGELRSRLVQQLLGRYGGIQSLTREDLKLEWMQLALRFYLCDRVIRVGEKGLVALRDLVDFTGLLDFDQAFAFYDQPANGGAGQGKLNAVELFELTSDLVYSQRMLDLGGGELSYDSLNGASQREALIANLSDAFPGIGPKIILEDNGSALRAAYWNGLQTDRPLDAGALTLDIGFLRLCENIFILYDTNHDGMLSRPELSPLFSSLGVTDSRQIDAFFDDVGLSGKTNFWTGVKFTLDGKAKRSAPLAPYPFYVRLMEVAPAKFFKGIP